MFFEKNEELGVEDAIGIAQKIINEKTGIIKSLNRIYQYPDEPKIFGYTAVMCNTSMFSDGGSVDKLTGGASFNEKRAVIKSIGEAIERYCLSIYRERDLRRTCYNKIEDKAMDPSKIANIYNNKYCRVAREGFKFGDKTDFMWKEGFSLQRNQRIYVPAQLVYVPYKFKNEPVIRWPITTGAAAGTCMAAAIYRGICEIVERDAFMITYLNKLSPEEINIENINNKEIQKIRKSFEKFNLEVHVFDITTDIRIHSIMSILLDHSDTGPAISVGLKADLDMMNAIIGALEESYHSRPWIRNLLSKNSNKKEPRKKSNEMYLLEDRGLFWSSRKMIGKLDFLLKHGKFKNLHYSRNRQLNPLKKLEKCTDLFNNENMEIIFVDVTTPDIKSLGFYAVKVIITGMQPLYLDERYKYFEEKRLIGVPKALGISKNIKITNLNKIPHPFL